MASAVYKTHNRWGPGAGPERIVDDGRPKARVRDKGAGPQRKRGSNKKNWCEIYLPKTETGKNQPESQK